MSTPDDETLQQEPREPSSWSREPQDLSSEAVLRNCPWREFEGEERPSIGRLTLLSKLGQGGMGVVYHGVNPRLGTEVAIKVLPLAMQVQQDAAVVRFLREARLAAQLKSEHLVSVLDVDEDEDSGCHFIVMEYVHGLSAASYVHRLKAAGRPGAPEAEALDICIAATRGLVAAHLEGIVHRDVKPANILVPVGPDGRVNAGLAKLADLGLARSDSGEKSLTGTQVAMGTPGYMAPEQANDSKRAKKPADVFGMGATLYALLIGVAPFAASSAAMALVRTVQGKYEPIGDVRPEVSPATARLIETCLAPEPGARFPDASALLDALYLCRTDLRTTGGTEDRTTELLQFVQRAEQGKRVATHSAIADDPSEPRTSTRERAERVLDEVIGLTLPPEEETSVEEPGAKSRAPVIVAAVVILAAVVSLLTWQLGGTDETPQEQTAAKVAPKTTVAEEPDAGPDGEPDLEPERKTPPPKPVVPGLKVTSVPSGATVFVDGDEKGLTPLHIPGLAQGRHAVRLELAGYETHQDTAESRLDELTAHEAILEPERGKVRIKGGAPSARVELVRIGEPVLQVFYDLDAVGATVDEPIRVGAYSVKAVRAGFATHSGQVTIKKDSTSVVVLEMPEADGELWVNSIPEGAEVRLDGKLVAKTPLEGHPLTPGPHTVTLSLAEHVAPFPRKGEGRGAKPWKLGTIRLTPWPAFDLSSLEEDVTASHEGKPVVQGQRVPPGRLEVVLARPGFAQQRLRLVGKAGESVSVRAKDWDLYQARLDLRDLAADVGATIDGKREKGLLRYAVAKHVDARFEKRDHFPITETIVLGLGETKRPQPFAWKPLPGTLDMGSLGAGVRVFLADGTEVGKGHELPPGTHRLVLRLPSHHDQELTVEVSAGRTVEVSAKTWQDAPLTRSEARAMLQDIAEWTSAKDADKLAAARMVEDTVSGFSFLRMEGFTCGDQSNEVAVFQHARTKMEFVLVPVGRFRMGSPKNEGGRFRPETLHTVTLRVPFLIARTEVTQAAWDAVGGVDKRKFRGPDLPIESLSWNVAAQWCKRAGLSLPTEAQWEYACRAGSTTRYCFGDETAGLDDYAWHGENAQRRTHPVGKKKANAFGLYDVHGNVWEWCSDAFRTYPTGHVTEPRVKGGPTEPVVYRGGSWYGSARLARSANRYSDAPNSVYKTLGLRPVAPVELE